MPTQQTPITLVLLKPRINERVARRLMDAGVRFNTRSKDRQTELTQRNVQRAAEVGRDGFRGNRVDAAGNTQADSGTPIFSWEGREGVSLRFVLADLTTHFGPITDIHLFQKEGDRMFTLVIVFKKGESAIEIPASAQAIVDQILSRAYGFLHAFRNPNGSATINPSHVLDQEPTDVKDLRVLDSEAHMRCVAR